MRSRVYKHLTDKYIEEHCPCSNCRPPKRYGGCRNECDAWKVYEKEYSEYKVSLSTMQKNEFKTFPTAMSEREIEKYRRRIKA